jgi:hypothetical protein
MDTIETLTKDVRHLEALRRENRSDEVDNALSDARERLQAALIDASGRRSHLSSCATSRAPAYTPGPCDCVEQVKAMPAGQREHFVKSLGITDAELRSVPGLNIEREIGSRRY